MARIEPDRASLEIAHRKLHVDVKLDDMLKNPTFEIILKAVARDHIRRRGLLDVKRLQANDHQEAS